MTRSNRVLTSDGDVNPSMRSRKIATELGSSHKEVPQQAIPVDIFLPRQRRTLICIPRLYTQGN